MSITSSKIGTFLGNGDGISLPSNIPQRIKYNKKCSSKFQLLDGNQHHFTYRLAAPDFHNSYLSIVEGIWERILISLALKGDFTKIEPSEIYDADTYKVGGVLLRDFYRDYRELPSAEGYWDFDEYPERLLKVQLVKKQYGRYGLNQFWQFVSFAKSIHRLLEQNISGVSIENYGYVCSPFMLIGEWDVASWSRKTPKSTLLFPFISFSGCKNRDGVVEVLKETIPYAPSITTSFSTKDRYWKGGNTSIIDNATQSEIDKIINNFFGWDIATCCGRETFEAITNRIAKQKVAAENVYKTACEEALKKQTEDNKVAQTNYEEKGKEENERYDVAVAKIDKDYAEYLESLNPEKVIPAREEYEKTVEQAEKEYTEAEKKAKKIKVDANNEITETRETKVENAKSKLDKEDITIDEYKSLINDIYAEWLEGYEANNKTYDESCETAKQSQNEKEAAALEKYQAVLKEVEQLKEDEAKKVEDKKKAESEQHETNLTEAKDELAQKKETYQSIYEAAVASAKQTYDAAINAYDSELQYAKYQTGNDNPVPEYTYNTDGMPIDIWLEGQPSDYDISTNAKYADKDNIGLFKKPLWINFLRSAFRGNLTGLECLSTGLDSEKQKIGEYLADSICNPFIIHLEYNYYMRFAGYILPITASTFGRFAPFGVFAIWNSYGVTKESETIFMNRINYRHRNISRNYSISVGFYIKGTTSKTDIGYDIGYTVDYSIGEKADWVDEESYRANSIQMKYDEKYIKTRVFPIDRHVKINIDALKSDCLTAYKGEEGGQSGVDNVIASVFKNLAWIEPSVKLPDEIVNQHKANVDEKYNEALAEKEKEYTSKCSEYETKLSDMQDEHKKEISDLESGKYYAGLECKSYYYGSGILPIYQSVLADVYDWSDFTIPDYRVDTDAFNDACESLDYLIEDDKYVIDGDIEATDTEKELATTRYNAAQDVLSDYAKGLKSSDRYYDNLIAQRKTEHAAEEAELEEEYNNYKEEYKEEFEAWVAQQNKQKEEDAKDGNYADVIAITMNKFLNGVAKIQNNTTGSFPPYISDAYYKRVTDDAQKLQASFSATFPSGKVYAPTSSECLIDCTGFDYYPNDVAIEKGYTDEPILHSFWEGEASLYNGNEESSSRISTEKIYSIWKSDFQLGKIDLNADIIRDNHISIATYGVMAALENTIYPTYKNNGGEMELITNEVDVETHINNFANLLPTEEEVKSKAQEMINGANWGCADDLYLFVAMDVSASNSAISQKTGQPAISIGIGTKNDITWYEDVDTAATVSQSPFDIQDCIPITGYKQALSWECKADFKGFVGTFDWKWKALVYNDY